MSVNDWRPWQCTLPDSARESERPRAPAAAAAHWHWQPGGRAAGVALIIMMTTRNCRRYRRTSAGLAGVPQPGSLGHRLATRTPTVTRDPGVTRTKSARSESLARL